MDCGGDWRSGRAPEIVVVAAWGVCSPGSLAGYGMFRSTIKARGLNIVKSSE